MTIEALDELLQGALAYAYAEQALASAADDDCLIDGLLTLADYRVIYEQVRADMLDAFEMLEGPTIGGILGEAAGAVWPSVYPEL